MAMPKICRILGLSSVKLIIIVINGLLLLFSTSIQVSAFIVNDGPGPKLSFLQEPSEHAIVSKKFPAFLPCSLKFSDSIIDDFGQTFDDFEDDDDSQYRYEEDDDESILHRQLNSELNTSERKKLTHFNSLKSDDELVAANFGVDDFPNHGYGDKLFSNGNQRFRRHAMESQVTYVWFRNDEILDVYGSGNFELMSNGSLKISYSNEAQGRYRCFINATRTNFGAIISKEASVITTEFTRSNLPTTITAEIDVPVILNCPIFSSPPATVTWFFNDTNISPNKTSVLIKNNRYFQLQNGSLLITKITGHDYGKFKCVARNDYLQKSQRVFKTQVKVVSRNEKEFFKRVGHLLPLLQNETLKIMEGSTLSLFCVGIFDKNDAHNEVQWTFTPRSANIPIPISNMTVELKFLNVTRERHDGVYNCSTVLEYQVFDVTILTPPIFTQTFNSINTRMATSITLPCDASGYPKPNITWYRNGVPLSFSPPRYYENGVLRLHSVDPSDEGIYQCFARNEAKEVSISGYLTLRKKVKLQRLYQVKCYPVNYMTLYVTFKSAEQFDMANYYLATENPYSWKPIPVEIRANNSFKIMDHLIPLKEYILYVRGLKNTELDKEGKSDTYEISRMSKGIRCSTQGLEIFSIAFPNQIFVWWPKFGSGVGYGIEMDSFVIQFWHNNTMSPTVFTNTIIGTAKEMDEFFTWQEIEKVLIKISVNMAIKTADRMVLDSGQLYLASSLSKNMTITEVRVPGDVTGILIPNANRVVARVLGVRKGESLDKQDLRFVQWKIIENSPNGISKLRVVNANSKNVQLSWNAFDTEKNNCLMLCYKQINVDVMLRGGIPDCKLINSNKSSVVLKPLPPLTTYKMYLKTCNSSEPITEMIDVHTRPDVPGKVCNPRLVVKEDDVIFSWDPPLSQTGVKINYYIIEWSTSGDKRGSFNASISETSYKVPVDPHTLFNISIKAMGNTGVGVPHYFNLYKPMSYYGDTNRLWSTEHSDSGISKEDDLLLAIIIGAFVCVLSILICSLIIFFHRRHAKKRQLGNDVNALDNNLRNINSENNLDNGVLLMNNANESLSTDVNRINEVTPNFRACLSYQPNDILRSTANSFEEENNEDDTHEMQTLVVQVVPNITMTTTLSDETLGLGDNFSNDELESDEDAEDDDETIVASTPLKTLPSDTKNGIGAISSPEESNKFQESELPSGDFLEFPISTMKSVLMNNNNPVIPDKNSIKMNGLKKESPRIPVLKSFQNSTKLRLNGGNGSIKMPVLDDSEDSQMHLLDSSSHRPAKSSIPIAKSTPSWSNFRRPIIGPNG